MTEPVLDLITVGAGPAGLICAITAASGVPIEPPRGGGRILLVDKGEIGQFARYGKLRLTHRWHFMGGHLIRSLESEARAAGLVLRDQEAVVGVDLSGEVKVVETTKRSYRTRAVALCPGFFPHGPLMKHPRAVRPVFSPAGLEARVITARPGERLVILGGGPSTLRFAAELKALRPELAMTVVIEEEGVDLGPAEAAGLEACLGRLELLDPRPGDLRVAIDDLDGRRREALACVLLLVDYNSYTTATRVTDFLGDAPLERRRGYLVVDEQGRTSIPGVVAAGNIVTPVSGVLTALSTGFTAGLSVYQHLQDLGGEGSELFPWLPREGLEAHPLSER